eukprot:10958730-Heterocapsa_arctica.AAC.1
MPLTPASAGMRPAWHTTRRGIERQSAVLPHGGLIVHQNIDQANLNTYEHFLVGWRMKHDEFDFYFEDCCAAN